MATRRHVTTSGNIDTDKLDRLEAAPSDRGCRDMDFLRRSRDMMIAKIVRHYRIVGNV